MMIQDAGLAARSNASNIGDSEVILLCENNALEILGFKMLISVN